MREYIIRGYNIYTITTIYKCISMYVKAYKLLPMFNGFWGGKG